MKRFPRPFAFVAALSLTALSCNTPTRLEHPDWAPDVRQGINDLVEAYGNSPERQYAVFDFDNTSTIFDVTENMMYYQILTMSFATEPERLREVLSTGVPLDEGSYAAFAADVGTAYRQLYDRFGPFTSKGLDDEAMEQVRTDPYWNEFGSKICNFYSYIYHNASPTVAYNWTKYWCCDMTADEAYELAVRSHRHCSSIPTSAGRWCGDGVTSALGPMTYEYILGFSIPEPVKELWKVLSSNAIDVWVCSASGTVPVLAAIDMFGLKPWCSGVLSMTIGKNKEGRFDNYYDYDGRASLPCGTGWKTDSLATGAQTCGQGKVTAIVNAIAPKYGGRGPIACFMDSMGDFNFCTEFQDTKLAVCFNRGDRKITDGGSLIGETAIYERDVLGYDLRKANENGDILYLLQGRDDNGMRCLRPSNATITLGSADETLFAGQDNRDRFDRICRDSLTVREIINSFSAPSLVDYPGYKTIK
ncbi:MAG: hypothetical protein MJY50_04725 [Bacteroidales bacterium]|nr:hypothetical protein [Bacteroidales bacterium]